MAILVDTFNLRLEQGSGIKTYGVSLLHALKDLGLSADLLGDRRLAAGAEPWLREVSFFDARRPKARDYRGPLGALRAATAALTGRRTVPIGGSRVLSALSGYVRGFADLYRTIHNAPEVYDLSLLSFGLTRRFTTVKVSPQVKIFHQTTPLPIRVSGAAHVVTVHDLIPLRLPFTTLDDKRFFHRLVKTNLKRADRILTVSEHSKRDLVELFGIDPAQIHVTWQALPKQPPLDPDFARGVINALKLKAGGYVLYAGNIEPKKNLRPLIRAVVSLPHRLPLVVVGRKAWLWEAEIGQAQQLLGKRFMHLDYLPREELRALYSHAAALVFPSIYEGFGLPPLEAMAEGCPVVSSNAASLPEVLGDAALYFAPTDSSALRAQLVRVLEDSALRAELIERGHARVAEFSPQRYAQRLRAAYGGLL